MCGDVCGFCILVSPCFNKLQFLTEKAKTQEFLINSRVFGGKLGAGDGIRTRDIQNHNLRTDSVNTIEKYMFLRFYRPKKVLCVGMCVFFA